MKILYGVLLALNGYNLITALNNLTTQDLSPNMTGVFALVVVVSVILIIRCFKRLTGSI